MEGATHNLQKNLNCLCVYVCVRVFVCVCVCLCLCMCVLGGGAYVRMCVCQRNPPSNPEISAIPVQVSLKKHPCPALVFWA